MGMNDELFAELLESVREGGALLRGDKAPSHRSVFATPDVHYDRETDTLVITLRQERIGESDEVRPGVTADFGYDGQIVRFEISRASRIVEKTTEM